MSYSTADKTAVFGPSLGSGRMAPPSKADQDAKFAAYLERTEGYNEAIRAAGDVPWWEDGERRNRAAEQLRLPLNSPPEVVRRAMFDRRYDK